MFHYYMRGMFWMVMSPNKEDYIKAIHSLDGAYEIVSNKKIANKLSVSGASVTEMNARLVKEEFISHIPYKGVQLTSKGIRAANQLVRKHRLWEVFLYEVLGYQWDEVHTEADRLEHASSNKLINRLSEFLDQPKHDPHGGIIPNADGTVDESILPILSLSELENDIHFMVKEVLDDEELLNYLNDKGFELNQIYKIIARDSYDGTVTIFDNTQDATYTISGKATDSIKVIKVSNE